MSKAQEITIKRKQTYGCCSKIFCFRCFTCCQADDESLLTSRNRKQLSLKLISKYKKNESLTGQVSSLDVLIMLYTSEQGNKSEVFPYLRKCRLNPSFDPNYIVRNDLEYYVPQLINFLVFHEEMNNDELSEFILNACTANFFFAHLVHFNIHSVSAVVQKTATTEFQKVKDYLANLIIQMGDHYQKKMFLAAALFMPDNSERDKQFENKEALLKSEIILKYGTAFFGKEDLMQLIKPNDIKIINYKSIYSQELPTEIQLTSRHQQEENYWSCIKFWDDLIEISERLKYANPKIISLRADLCKVNERLPAAVYIPFVKDAIRNYALLNIITSETKVFSTKERAPFYLCLEIYRPEEDTQLIYQEKVSNRSYSVHQQHHQLDSQVELNIVSAHDTHPQKKMFQELDIELSKPITTNTQLRRNSAFISNDQDLEEQRQYAFTLQQNPFDLQMRKLDKEEKEQQGLQGHQDQNVPNEVPNEGISIAKFYESVPEHTPSQQQDAEFIEQRLDRLVSYKMDGEYPVGKISKKSKMIVEKIDKKTLEMDLFGEGEDEQTARLRKQSPFGQFQSWRLVHLIVKTGDNIKQEQFALQLIYQFDQIFKMEGLPLILTPYEIVSLGPSSGILEMVKDSSTIDSLKRKFLTDYKDIGTFSNFFNIYFGSEVKQAQTNFCHSLAAYCLVCYFLQVKDRHNGNILLHKTGKVIHIDFGFFLSIAPGKGLEFEKNVPFKLLSENIEILGGVQSSMFNHFRKLFFKGFQAAQKHQDKILLLVKMMYSGHGYTLPCFEKGELTIDDLEARFNPPVLNDGELYIFAQNLINQSLDNWRAKWYDKFQYYFQGIVY